MTAYLVANPPRRSQYRKPRRAVPTGTIILHSAENAPDLVLPDRGAEGIASFIQGRSDPGSYHVIADQDTQIQLVPFEWEAFGDGTGSNPWGIQLSLALRASDWPKLTDQQRLWYMASLATAAREASDWLLEHYGFVVPVRRLTKASANQAGFCTHQDRENWFGTPGRRTDPWRNDEVMWHLFLTLYADTAKPTPTQNEELDVQPSVLVVLTYNACLGRNPSMQEIANGMNAIDAKGQLAYVESIANSNEAKAHRSA